MHVRFLYLDSEKCPLSQGQSIRIYSNLRKPRSYWQTWLPCSASSCSLQKQLCGRSVKLGSHDLREDGGDRRSSCCTWCILRPCAVGGGSREDVAEVSTRLEVKRRTCTHQSCAATPLKDWFCSRWNGSSLELCILVLNDSCILIVLLLLFRSRCCSRRGSRYATC